MLVRYFCYYFLDTEVERTALQQYTFPPLRAFCKSKGHDLHIVDLRWGTHDFVGDKQDWGRIAKESIKDAWRGDNKGVSFIVRIFLRKANSLTPSLLPLIHVRN